MFKYIKQGHDACPFFNQSLPNRENNTKFVVQILRDNVLTKVCENR